MNDETIDVVVVNFDIERKLVFSHFFYSNYTTNKIKLLYGYKPPQMFGWRFGFNHMVDLVSKIEQRFHVYSTDNECVFMLSYRQYKKFILYASDKYHFEIKNKDEKMKIFDIAISNYISETAIIDMYASNSFHNSFAHISRGT